MDDSEQTTFTRRSLILPVYIPAFLLACGQGTIAPTLSIYIKSFDLSYTVTTFVVAVSVVGNLPAGLLLERIGRKPSMILGAVILALSTLGIGLASSLIELIIYQLVGGIGGALWSISRHAYMTDVVPIPERGRSIALFGGINRIGGFVGQLAALFLGTSLRTPFFLYAAVSGLTAFLCIFFVIETKRASKNVGVPVPRIGFLAVVKTHYRSLATAGLGQVCVQTLRQGRRIIIPLYGSEVIGLGPQGVRLIVMISSAVDMSMFPVAGAIMDRFGRKYAAVPCFFVFATGMAIMPFTTSFTTLLIATIVMGLGNGLGSGTMMTLGADLAPKEGTGQFLGVWRLIGDFGGATGPLVVGNIADLWGLGISGYALAGIGYAAVFIFFKYVPETLQRAKK